MDHNPDRSIQASRFLWVLGLCALVGATGWGSLAGERAPSPNPPAASEQPAGTLHDPTGLIPLTDMGPSDKYKGEEGGLYGGGKNDPPESQLQLAQQALKRIQPLDKEGKPASDGKIILISVGMSNTTEEFSRFVPLAHAAPAKAASVLVVDTAQGSRTAGSWARSEHAGTRSLGGGTVWDEAIRRVQAAGCTPLQVQAAWVKVAPSVKMQFPDCIKEFQANLASIAKLLKTHFPNIQIAYNTSRIYAGWATGPLNPEPWSYESAFGVRWVIQQQIKGDPELNADPAKGALKAPLLLWGPYLWADGTKPRKDGFTWTREEIGVDGVHPSSLGQTKVANALLKFFSTDSLAKSWFTGKP